MSTDRVAPEPQGTAGAAAKKGRPQPFSFHDFAVASVISFGLALIFGSYLLYRRGYLFGSPSHVDAFYVPNKVIVGVGLVLLAFTFLIGPISRYFNAFDFLVRYRKEIGIVGAFYALFHSVVSYFFLPLKFPESELRFTSLIYGAGIICVFLLIFLYVISFQKAIDLLGNNWWFLQRFGLRLVILFALLHVYPMKFSGWIKWIKQGGGNPLPELANPWLPGLGTLTGMFLTWVVIFRLYETIFLYRDLGFKTKDITRDEKLRRHGRWFFLITFGVLIAGYVFILTRWI